MTAITNQQGETIAYLHLNIILNPERDTVWGLILGNCVFGETEAPVGKFFKDSFRGMNGEIIAELGSETSSERPSNEPAILKQAWAKLTGVKNHLCMWVEEKNKWSDEAFEQFLQLSHRNAIAV
ncbi:MAG: hypothetical protein ACK4S0_09675 [Sediminibacterium sp.]|nr:hypothetical protein [uncultured Sediminibacterium sp.]